MWIKNSWQSRAALGSPRWGSHNSRKPKKKALRGRDLVPRGLRFRSRWSFPSSPPRNPRHVSTDREDHQQSVDSRIQPHCALNPNKCLCVSTWIHMRQALRPSPRQPRAVSTSQQAGEASAGATALCRDQAGHSGRLPPPANPPPPRGLALNPPPPHALATNIHRCICQPYTEEEEGEGGKGGGPLVVGGGSLHGGGSEDRGRDQ